MADNYTRLSDTISAKEGTGYITINGKNRALFELSSAKAQLDLTVSSRNMLGHRMVQHKVTGAEGTGSLTMYFMNSQLLKEYIAYVKSGVCPTISLQLRNADAQSTVGAQDVVLRNVIIATIPVANIDDQSDDPVTVDSDFTFDDIDGLEYFKVPENFR